MSASSRLDRASPPANARSAFVAKWLNTVFSNTSAAAATSAGAGERNRGTLRTLAGANR